MIAPLRRRHRLMLTTLAIVVPVGYVVALAARPDAPITPELPTALAGTTVGATAGEVDHDFGELFTDPAIVVRAGSDGSRWWIELDPRSAVSRPEALVYWSEAPAADRLPEDAYLIGSLAGNRARTFTLPVEALGRAGHLVLYSLGHQEVFASASLPAVGHAPVDLSPPGAVPSDEVPDTVEVGA